MADESLDVAPRPIRFWPWEVGPAVMCSRCCALVVDDDEQGVMPAIDQEACQDAIDSLAAQMRANSERWFPRWHSDDLGMPLSVAYALGLAGEVGEVANVVKKIQRDGWSEDLHTKLGAEVADVFTYLLLLAEETGIELVVQYRLKVHENERRWGDG